MGRLNVVWRRSEYQRLREEVAGIGESDASALDADGTLEDALRTFCLAVHDLRAGRGDLQERMDLAERLLDEHEVGWRRSKLACMRADLHQALADAHAADGQPFLAAWNGLVAHGLAPGTTHPDQGIEDAVAWFRQLDVKAQSEGPASLRRSGRVLEARAAAELALAREGSDEVSLTWELACCDASLGGSSEPLAAWLADRVDVPERRQVVARLFALALPRRQHLLEVTPAADAHPLVLALAAAADSATPLDARVARLGPAIAALRSDPDPECVALGLGAVARFLHGVRRHAFARLVQACLGAVGLALSGGTTTDVFRTNLDVEAPPLPASRVGGWRRTTDAGLLLTRMSTALGISRVRQLFRSGARAKRLQDEERDQLGRILAEFAGHLKGPVMKGAQHLAYLGLSFDPEVDRVLQSLYDRSPAMPFEQVQAVVENELRLPLDAVFASFDPEPLGTGSVGQVHRAVLLDGTEVALKVQYPGIRAAIVHDIWALRRVAPILRILVPRTPWSDILDEVEEQLLAETDYRQEARMQECFAAAFAEHPRVRIPATWPDLTTERLLVMELAKGERHSDFARTAPAARRRRATEALYTFFLTPTEAQGLYADFNPGNFLFDDDSVWCLDFGCVKTWPPAQLALVQRFTIAAVTRDREAFRAVAREMDVTSDPDHFDFDRLLWQFDPESCRRFDDEGRPLPFEPADAARILANFTRLRSDQTLQPYHLYGVRAYFSFLAMIVRLGQSDDGMSIARGVVESTLDA